MTGPGFHRRRIGDVVVTAIFDGIVSIPLDAVLNVAPDEARRLQDGDGRPYPSMATTSFFAVTSGDDTILIDAGGASILDPELGCGYDNLRAAGIDPAKVAAVLMTHLHTDHYGGLVRPDGSASFPNAELVMSAVERRHRFGTSETPPASEPPDYLVAALAPYADRLRLVADGEIDASLEAVALPGHTPGHTGWRIRSGSETLLVWGDVVHLPSIQFAHPEASMSYDTDPLMSAKSRASAFRDVAEAGHLVAGMHLDFPCFGRVVREGAAYRWES